MAGGLSLAEATARRARRRPGRLLHRRRARGRARHDRGGPPFHPARPRAARRCRLPGLRHPGAARRTPTTSSRWPTTSWPCSPRAPSWSRPWPASRSRPRRCTSPGISRRPRRTATTTSCPRRCTSSPGRWPTRCWTAATPPATCVLDEMRLSADDAAPDRQGVHRRLREQLPRRPGGQVRHGALGQAPHRGRHRQRVPLPGPGDDGAHTLRGRLPVGRDARYVEGHARRPPASAPRSWSSPTWSTPPWPGRPTACSTPGPGPRSAWPRPSATWPRSSRSSSSASRWPRCTARCPRNRSRAVLDEMDRLPDLIEEALRRVAGRRRRGRASWSRPATSSSWAATSASPWPSKGPSS